MVSNFTIRGPRSTGNFLCNAEKGLEGLRRPHSRRISPTPNQVYANAKFVDDDNSQEFIYDDTPSKKKKKKTKWSPGL